MTTNQRTERVMSSKTTQYELISELNTTEPHMPTVQKDICLPQKKIRQYLVNSDWALVGCRDVGANWPRYTFTRRRVLQSRARANVRKGKTAERTIANALSATYGGDWRRSGMQSQRGGADVPDIISEAHPDLHCECKVGKRPNVWAALEQAVADTKDNERTPFVVAHKLHGETVVMMRLDDLGAVCESLGRSSLHDVVLGEDPRSAYALAVSRDALRGE